MKTLHKKDFIIFLKNISDVLEKEEIKHDIPYCHIDKTTFNHIHIIIPEHIAVFDIGKLFNCTTIKEKTGIISAVIDDFDVKFVKTKESDWYYTFYYYCWNVLSVLVDILAYKSFNLRYTRTGLKYQYCEKLIDISNNMRDIFDFLELPFYMINNGFPTDYTIYSFIESSIYFDIEYFNMSEFAGKDPIFELNKKYYVDFLEHITEKTNVEKKQIDEQISLIDAYFSESKFLEKLSRIQLKEEFPNLKDKDIKTLPKQKDIKELKADKEEQINKRKKISLKNITKTKDDDLNFNIN
jgi:hypothetical protein